MDRRRSAFLLPVLSLLVASPAQALKPAREYSAAPGDYGIVHEPVSFQSPDSLRLVGWFFPAQDTAGIANDLVGRLIPVPEGMRRAPRPFQAPKPAPTVIICNGDAGNMGGLILYAYGVLREGRRVLRCESQRRGRRRGSALPAAANSPAIVVP